MRKISYAEAINETLYQEMRSDPTVFVYGLGAPDHKRVFGTTDKVTNEFPDRVLDMPLSEDAMVGFGIGAAVNGLRPINIHIRVDFLLLAMNQLVNMASSYNYTGGGPVPLVIRAIVGRGWGQGCHHSKSLHSYFTHIPGLTVIAPTTPRTVNGFLNTAIRGNNPVICLEHRWLYWAEAAVPEIPYTLPFGEACTLRTGNDLTVVGVSWMAIEALKAAEVLKRHHDVNIEVIDPSTLYPLDGWEIMKSVMRTRYCIVADNDWVPSGYSAELAAVIYETCFGYLRKPIERIGWKHTPCPTARHMENEFYCNAVDIIRAAERMLSLPTADLSGEDFYSHERKFKGPF